MASMRAAVYHSNSDVRVEDVPKPAAGPGELLLELAACGVCGSDVMEWYRKPKAPLVLGHEAVGRVVQVGQGAQGFREGDRVFASHHVPCMVCHACLQDRHTACDTLRRTSLDPGGFAQFARVPAVNVRHGTLHVPGSLGDDEATFVEPLGCAVRGQRRVGLRAGDSVLVLGCGVAGLLHVLLARALGAGPIVAVDELPARLDAARRCGADAAVAAGPEAVQAARKANQGRLSDVVLVATGALPALQQALRAVEAGGRVLWFAPAQPGQQLALPFNELWRNEVTLASTYGAAPGDLAQSLQLLAGGRVQVRDLVTHRLPMARVGEAFRLVAEAKESLKVVVHPNA
jgi:L-iditol 2-dehydrogenase